MLVLTSDCQGFGRPAGVPGRGRGGEGKGCIFRIQAIPVPATGFSRVCDTYYGVPNFYPKKPHTLSHTDTISIRASTNIFAVGRATCCAFV